jgi:rhomboid protease GluP
VPNEHRPSNQPARIFPVMVWAILLASCLPELILLAADYGFIGSARWRQLAYQNGGFWAGLLHGWQPNYAAQPLTMFFSYAFLHAGFGHLLGNMGALIGLGLAAQERLGNFGFAALYAVSALGGALAFGLLSHSPAPMVGASGALFGLAGAWAIWDCQQHRRTTPLWRAMLRLLVITAGLVLLNLLIWLMMEHHMAWETHFGGFLAGAAFAWLYRPALAKIRS